jgi:hypothetical protein
MFRRPKIAATLTLLIASSVLLLWQAPSYAASTKIYLTPSRSSVQVGKKRTLQLRINPATSVNAVQATVHYNTSALKLTSHSLGVFTLCARNSAGGGTVSLACAISGSSTSKNSLIATLTFKALTSHGSSGVTITGAKAAHAGSYVASTSSNASVSFQSKPAPPPPSNPNPPGHSSGHTHHTSSHNSHSPTKKTHHKSDKKKHDDKKTVLKDMFSFTPKHVQFTNAEITIKSKIKGKIYARFGTSKKKINHKTSKKQVSKNGKAVLQLKKLTPGTKYYYQVILEKSGSKDAKGNIASFTTKGFTVHIKVLGEHFYPLRNQPVVLHSSPYKSQTNQDGLATFKNITPGVHELEYSSKGKTYIGKVYVDNTIITGHNNTQAANPQTIAAVLSGYTNTSATQAADTSSSMATWAVILITVAITVFVIAALLRILVFRKLAFIRYMSKHYTISQLEQLESAAKDNPGTGSSSTTIQPSDPGKIAGQNDQSNRTNI